MAVFKVGNLVVLKSGGPVMTVEEVFGGDRIKCPWFSGKKLEDGYFAPASLQAAPPEPPKTEK